MKANIMMDQAQLNKFSHKIQSEKISRWNMKKIERRYRKACKGLK